MPAAYPFLIVDALVIKIRDSNCIFSYSALIAPDINQDGYREILGMRIGDSESEGSWSDLFAWLKSRGLHGIDFIISDHHGGLIKAVAAHFQGAT